MASRLKALFHSRDLDGLACGALMRIKHPNANLIPIDYGDEFPLDMINKHDVVAFLDWFPNDFELIEKIFGLASVFWVVDHHVSSRKAASKHNFYERMIEPSVFITDSEDKKEAACELTYKWLNNTDKVPYYLSLLGRYDVWDHSDPNTLPFQYAARAWLDDPRYDIQKWKRLIYMPRSTDEQFMQGLIEKGKFIMEYERKQSEKLAKAQCFETEFEGYRVIAINKHHPGSKFFDSVYDPKKHDIMVGFAWDGKQWTISVYSDPRNDVDVSELARKYSGGGHRNSAGWQVSEIPRELLEV